MNRTVAEVQSINCSGCALCLSICPEQAITMQEDAEGFLYPEIDNSKCSRCGICYNSCPFKNILKSENSINPEAWSCWHRDRNILLSSSSGGVFSALSSVIFREAGVVYGACCDREFKVKHIRIEVPDQLVILRGSKYTQSDISDIYNRIREDIHQGRKVFFTGTPCQIAGVYRFLEKQDLENLFTCDLICHGVNSRKILMTYIEYREARKRSKIDSIDFRNKEQTTWDDFYIKLSYQNYEMDFIKNNKDPFMNGYLKNIYLRKSCYKCLYSKLPRIADLTIGDFWCWDRINRPKHFNLQGTSLVLLNNDKGKKLFLSASKELIGSTADINKAIRYNKNIIKPSSLPKNKKLRSLVFRLALEKNFIQLFESVLKPKTSISKKIVYFLSNPDKLLAKLQARGYTQ